MSQETPKNNTVLIVVAIIGVIGTIVATAIGAIANYNIERFRQEAELTRIALVSIATQGGATQASMAGTISAPTSTPYPTNELQPTYTPYPTYTPVPPPIFTSTPSYAFFDNFDSGPSPEWEVTNGSIIVVNGQLTTDNLATLFVGDTNWTDYKIEFDMIPYQAWMNDESLSVFVRVKDMKKIVGFVVNTFDSEWDIVQNGNWNEVPTSYNSDAQLGWSGKVMLVVKGGNFEAYLNGYQVSSFYNADFPNGKVGIRIGHKATIDNFKITLIP